MVQTRQTDSFRHYVTHLCCRRLQRSTQSHYFHIGVTFLRSSLRGLRNAISKPHRTNPSLYNSHRIRVCLFVMTFRSNTLPHPHPPPGVSISHLKIIFEMKYRQTSLPIAQFISFPTAPFTLSFSTTHKSNDQLLIEYLYENQLISVLPPVLHCASSASNPLLPSSRVLRIIRDAPLVTYISHSNSPFRVFSTR